MAAGKLIKFCIFFFAFLPVRAFPQFNLHLVAKAPAGTDVIFVTGSFNNWNPGDSNYRLQFTSDGNAEITIRNLPATVYKYKFTRGSPATFECSETGTNINPHNIQLTKDTSVNGSITAWSDAYFDLQKLHDSALNEAMMGRAGYYVEINLDSSYKYAVQLYELSRILGLPLKEARALDLQATVFTKQGNAQKALELLLKSLAIKKKLNDSSGGTSFTYGSIGKIYEYNGDFANAHDNYTNAVSWLNKPNEIFKATSLASIGNLFLSQKNIDSASWYAEQALRYNSDYFGALLLSGDISMQKNNFTGALSAYRAAALASSRTLPGTALYTNQTEPLWKIALLYDAVQQKDSAYIYAAKAFSIASHVNNPAAIAASGTVLVNLFAKEKKYDSAFMYQSVVMQKKDSLFTVEKQRQIQNIYFNEKLQLQEASARAEQNSARIKIFLLMGLSALVILLGLAYRVMMKNRFYKQVSEIEMRALRAQMNPHFIFNCLASINRYIVKSDTKAASAYLTKFSKLIRLILDNSSNELVSLDTEIQTLKLYMDMELLRFGDSFEYEIVPAPTIHTASTAIPAMIIQPYVENAIWHGLLQPVDGETGLNKKKKLWVRFLPHTNDTIKIEIEDNGIGRQKAADMRSEDVLKTKSYGMQISKDRIGLINSQYRIKSSVSVTDLSDDNGIASGTKVTLYLPLIEITGSSPAVNKKI